MKKPCSIPDCGRASDTRGLCKMHIRRVKLYGDPHVTLRPELKMTVEERFWAKVNKTETCWLWTACTTWGGYGDFRVNNDLVVKAHRFSYEALVGPIPDGLFLDHLCRVPPCVNPDHLEPVTSGENTRRGAAVITHCPSGHPYNDKNTYRYQGHRQCLACKRDRYWARKLEDSA